MKPTIYFSVCQLLQCVLAGWVSWTRVFWKLRQVIYLGIWSQGRESKVGKWNKWEKANWSSILRDFLKRFMKYFSKLSAKGRGGRTFINQVKDGSTVITSLTVLGMCMVHSNLHGRKSPGQEVKSVQCRCRGTLSGCTWQNWGNFHETVTIAVAA